MKFPDSEEEVMKKTSVLSFDIIALPGANCVAAQFSYTQKLLLYTMLPPICLAALITPLLVVVVLGKGWFKGMREHPKYQAVYANTWQYGQPQNPKP